jgi:predicted amidophosphoribosyltransferase
VTQFGKRLPPRAHCRECGKDLGRMWAEAPLCDECSTPLTTDSLCICVVEDREFTWNPLCERHTHDPYDIPF